MGCHVAKQLCKLANSVSVIVTNAFTRSYFALEWIASVPAPWGVLPCCIVAASLNHETGEVQVKNSQNPAVFWHSPFTKKVVVPDIRSNLESYA